MKNFQLKMPLYEHMKPFEKVKGKIHFFMKKKSNIFDALSEKKGHLSQSNKPLITLIENARFNMEKLP